MVAMSNLPKKFQLGLLDHLLRLHRLVSRFHSVEQWKNILDVDNEILCKLRRQVALAHDTEHAGRQLFVLEKRVRSFGDGVFKRQLVTGNVPVAENRAQIDALLVERVPSHPQNSPFSQSML